MIRNGAKEATAGLIGDVGFDPVGAGPLQFARCLGPFSLAVAQPAYDRDRGPELAYRCERFESKG